MACITPVSIHTATQRTPSGTARSTLRRALRDSALNLRVSTPGLVCTLHRAAAKVTPNLLCLPLADWLSHV